MKTKAFLTKQETADELSCCTRTVDHLEKAGLIKPIRHGRFVRYPVSELESLRKKLQAK